MHLELLVEELSAKIFLDIFLSKLLGNEHTFKVHSFAGKNRLISKLEQRLRAYKHWLPNNYKIVILVDQDNDDCIELKQKLKYIVERTSLSNSVLIRIAIEELEAWYFGDMEALQKVYPKLPNITRRRGYRNPDEIKGGTWEALDRFLQEYGYSKLSKLKIAELIAPHIHLERNKSHSFRVFCEGIRKLMKS